MPDHDVLVAALQRARRRLGEALPHSPEWCAAIEEVEELEALEAKLRTPDPPVAAARPLGAVIAVAVPAA